MDFQEREIKLYVQDLSALAERLRVSGATLTRERTLERNLRMDTPDNSLAKGGRLLRLREDNRVRVTYKDNAQFEKSIISRTEIEFTADDLQVVRKLFEALGYQVVVIYEKYRRIYRIGDVEVSLDELPFGDFVEIEAPNNTLIEGVCQMLGLDPAKGIQTNYLGLFERVKKNAQLDFANLTFDSFKAVEITPSQLEVEQADL